MIQCPFPCISGYNTVAITWDEGRGYCEAGDDCPADCEYSYPGHLTHPLVKQDIEEGIIHTETLT